MQFNDDNPEAFWRELPKLPLFDQVIHVLAILREDPARIKHEKATAWATANGKMLVAAPVVMQMLSRSSAPEMIVGVRELHWRLQEPVFDFSQLAMGLREMADHLDQLQPLRKEHHT